MKVLIYNYETKQLINQVSLKTKANTKNPFGVLTDLRLLTRDTDILCLSRDNYFVKDFGITSFYMKGATANSLSKGASMTKVTGTNSFIFGNLDNDTPTIPSNVEIYINGENGHLESEELSLKVGIILYEEGWVISTGTERCNILGGKHESYLSSIGSRNIRTNGVENAKIFATKKALLSYIEKHKDTLEFCSKQYGWVWNMQPTCPEFLESFNDALNEKSKIKDKELTNAINELFDEINHSDMMIEDEIEVPSEITKETLTQEVIYRMKKLNLWDEIISKYEKNGTIYMSEFGGVIYDLDDGAKEAIKRAKESNLNPYHVVKTTTTFGVLYDVLYVSNTLEEWSMERDIASGYIFTMCYNQSTGFDEIGECKFIGGTGGLTRTA